MTVLFEDVKKGIDASIGQDRLDGVDFDEVLFADDIICLSRCKEALEKDLACN